MTAAKNGRTGRPKLPAGRARKAVVTLRFTNDEWAAIEAAAVRDGLAFAEWVRAVAVAAADGRFDMARRDQS